MGLCKSRHGTKNIPALSLNSSLTNLIEDKYKLTNNTNNQGKVEELRFPDITKWVNMSIEQAKFEFNDTNQTHKFQVYVLSDKRNSNTTATTKLHNNYVSTLSQHKSFLIKKMKESCLNLKSKIMQEIANIKNEFAKSKWEMKDKEGTRILNIITTAATETAKIMDTINISNKSYKKLKLFNDFISGINKSIDKWTKEMKTLYSQIFDNICLDIDDRAQGVN